MKRKQPESRGGNGNKKHRLKLQKTAEKIRTQRGISTQILIKSLTCQMMAIETYV